MPDKWPLANGNWNNAANWNDGTLPQPGDDVYADGRTVTINQDVNVASIRNTQRSGGTAGGLFSTSGTRTITGNLIQGAANLLAVNADLTLNGNVNGGTAGTNGCIYIPTSINNLIINGNVTGGSGSGGRGIYSDRAENTVITGNVTGGSASGAEAYNLNFGGGAITGSITIVGNVLAGASPAISFTGGGSTKPITVTGNVTGGVTAAISLISGTAGAVTVTGNVTGGASGSGITAASGATANIDITGNCYGSSSGTGVAVSYSGTGRVRVIGDVYAGIGNSGVGFSSVNGINRISGNLYSSTTGYPPITGNGRIVFDNSATRTITARADNAGAVGAEFGYSTDTNLPSTGNVRQGITYGAGGLQVGTCAVPGAASVVVGVPVDNTVGTAAITEATIRSALGLASANLDTQLGNIATLAYALPTLTEIEASSVLAKSTQITSLQNNAPSEAF